MLFCYNQTMTKINTQKLVSPTPPQKRRINWTLLGIFTILTPLLWYVLFFIWHLMYGVLFQPPGGDTDYSWGPLVAIFVAIGSAVLAVPVGIGILILRRRLSPLAVIVRRILAALALIILVGLGFCSVWLSLSWGGQTSFSSVSGEDGYAALSTAVEAVMQSSDISWNGHYKLEKSDSADACPGGYKLVVSPDSYTVEGTVQTTTDAAIESSRSALESGGWTTSLLEGQKKNGVTPLYLSGHRPDLGTIYVRFNDTVTIGVSSVCFKGY